MTDPASDAEGARAARNSAKVRMEQRFSALKGGYLKKGLGARIGDQLSDKVKGAAQGAVDVARDSKGVLAGTAGLLGLWLARRPLTSMGRKLWARAKARMDKGF